MAETATLCSLILLQADAVNFKTSRSFLRKFLKSQLPLANAKKYFKSLMSALIPEKIEAVLATIMEFLRNENLWKTESVCCEILQTMLSCRALPETVLDKLLDYIEKMISNDNIIECRHVIRVLHSIISDDNFSTMPDTGVIRLLHMFHSIVENNDEKMYFICSGLECVLVRILRVIDKDEVGKLFPSFLRLTFQTNLAKLQNRDFGVTLSNAIKRMRSKEMSQNLQPELVRFLLSSMMLESDVKSFLATHYLTLIIDHFSNYEQFSSPMIFHENTNFEIHLGPEDDEKRSVVEEYRDHFEKAIITNIRLHSNNRDNLNSIYSLICVLVVSNPNGYTIVSIICILMNLQSLLLANDQAKFSVTQANHLHSLIASTLTLVCWVTRAKSLVKYVHEIVNLRYSSARHLNPPIMDNYPAAENKDDFFFDSWDIRYCLWKRYRLYEELESPVNPLVRRPKVGKQHFRQKKFLHQRKVTFIGE